MIMLKIIEIKHATYIPGVYTVYDTTKPIIVMIKGSMKEIFLICNSFNFSLDLLAPKTTITDIIWEKVPKTMSNPNIVSAAKEYKFNESQDAKYGNSENKKIEIPYAIRD
ncbi:MAG: hypothetical protein BZ135_08475, partial [Methanosphaera sp. rholeuAM6]